MAELPLVNLGFVVGTFISALLAFIAIVVSDKVISHSIDAKKSLIMALIALFIVPIAATFILGSAPVLLAIPYFASILLPLLFWIGLGEALLKSDRKTKLKVTVVAFIVYIILDIFLKPAIISALP